MFFDCDKCALKRSGPAVSYEGPKDAALMIVGLCPGGQEIKIGRPFVGASGSKLNEALRLAGLKREDIYITNLVKCYNPPGKQLNKTFARICSDTYLQKEIEQVKPKVIIVLGQTASNYFGDRFIANSHFYDEVRDCWIVVTHHPARLLRTYDDKIHNEFKEAFRIAKSLLDKIQQNTPDSNVEYLESLEDLTINKLNELGSTIAIDLETTGLNFLEDRIVGIGLSDGKKSLAIPLYAVDNVDKLITSSHLQTLNTWLSTKRIIGHHFKFDQKFLKKIGIEANLFFDTMLAHFLIDRESSHGLDAIALKYLHTKLTKGTIDFEEGPIDVKERSVYGANDAWMTFKIYEIFKPIIDENYSKVFYDIMVPTSQWLAEAEYRGIKVNRDYVKNYLNTAKYQLASIEQDIQDDLNVKAFCAKQGLPKLNLRSPKQIKDLLYGYLKLKSRVKKTGEAIISELSNKYPQHLFLQKILDYRHLYKSYRTYLQNLITFSESDGRVHCTYNQTRVPTGRLASSNPNMQNIPKNHDDESIKDKQAKIIRKAFIATEGYSLVEVDYKQAEFRTLAHYSRDPYMINLINDGKDIHKIIASVAYLKKEEDVTGNERTIAKTIVFGLMYGRGAKSISESLGIPLEEAQKIKDTFFNTFKQAGEWIKEVQAFAKRNGYIKTLTGRKITLPQIYSKDPEQVAYGERVAVNYPIQGVVGDITNLMGALMYKAIKAKQLDAYVVMNIHDAIIVECKTELVETIKQEVKKIAEQDIVNMLGFKVKLEVDSEVGQNLAFE